MHNFNHAYKQLNASQKQAVDYIDGPLLVLAGPGTGKTQLLSMRAANILQKTDTAGENILCLTFTEKAATEMRERMLKIIGTDARKINVKTFHGLGAEIIGQHPEYFFGGANLKPVPEAVGLDIIDSILGKLPLDNPLSMKFAGKFSQVRPTQNAIQRVKEAGMTPDELRLRLNISQDELDAADLPKYKHEPEQKRIIWYRSLADVYETYQKAIHKQGYFDFSDMILQVISKLEQNETLHHELQEQFNYIMIDEFQDTNGAQFKIAQLLSNHPVHEGRPNIMVVGDDDQAIYRFQGAEVGNMQAFKTHYDNVRTIVLTDNYRSNQQVLDAAAGVRETIINRLDVEKNITAKGTVVQGSIMHLSLPTRAHELTFMAHKIKDEFNENSDIAILARGHETLQQIAHILNQLGVPIRYERRSNVLDNPAVKLVIDILILLDSIRAGYSDITNQKLSQVLSHPSFNIPAKSLWQLALDARYKSWLDIAIKSNDTKILVQWLLNLAKMAHNQPISITIEHVLGLRELGGFVSPIKQHYIDSKLSDSYLQALSGMQSLRKLAQEFSKEDEPSLSNFLRFLTLNQSHNVTIADESAFVSADKAVRLMTAHGAKGLEFDTVYILDAIENVWQPGRARRKPPANLEELQEYGEDPDDYARLLFVAITRAKRNLYICSYREDEHGKEVLPSPLIHGVKTEKVPTNNIDLIEVVENDISWPDIDHSNEKLLLKPRLETYQMSVTHLLNFLDIERGGPKYFRNQNLIRLPSAKSPSLSYGSAIHDALERAQNNLNQGKPAEQGAFKVFEKKLLQEQLEKHELERYLEKGKQLLPGLLEDPRLGLAKGNKPEYTIKDIRVGNALIQGKLDRVDISDDQIVITDYKTGGDVPDLTSEAKSYGLRALKHRTQLIYYTLLAQEAGLNKKGQRIIGQMIYLEPKSQKNFVKTYEPTAEDIETLRKLINGVWQNIMSCTWPDVSNYSADLEGTKEFTRNLICK